MNDDREIINPVPFDYSEDPSSEDLADNWDFQSIDRLLAAESETVNDSEHRPAGSSDDKSDHGMLLAELRSAIRRELPPSDTLKAQSLLDSVKTRIERATARPSGASTDRPDKSRSGIQSPSGIRMPAIFRQISIAVTAAVLLIGTGSVVYMASRSESVSQTTVRTMSTRSGETATIVLRDGTQVMLGPSTSLTIPDDFGTSTRNVVLEGAAFFTVTHVERHPFVVTTSRTSARVLGTRFGVRSYKDEGVATIAVQSGRVVILDNDSTGEFENQNMIAGVNDVARIDATGITMLHGANYVEDLESFTKGQLVFTDARVATVLPELAKWFDVKFRVTDPEINQLLLTGAFDYQSGAELAHTLGVVLNVNASRNGNVITLTIRR